MNRLPRCRHTYSSCHFPLGDAQSEQFAALHAHTHRGPLPYLSSHIPARGAAAACGCLKRGQPLPCSRGCSGCLCSGSSPLPLQALLQGTRMCVHTRSR